MSDLVKALTGWQPYPSLIVAGVKRFETRSWAPPVSLWGERIAMHAAARPLVPESTAHDAWQATRLHIGSPLKLPRGVIVGTAVLRGAWQVEDYGPTVMGGRAFEFTIDEGAPRVERDDGLGDYSVGRWVWEFVDPYRLVVPIPIRGRQRLWNVPADVISGRRTS